MPRAAKQVTYHPHVLSEEDSNTGIHLTDIEGEEHLEWLLGFD